MDLDPRLTFDTFVVGPTNRLASAAARRAAESPGRSYNPLFLYSASGLGKSHILSSIGHLAHRANPGATVVYETLEGYLDELTRALQEGKGDRVREQYEGADILLLDDVQFLTGQDQAQEMLLRTLDTLTARNAQVVLASDRPPAEIDGLDARLLSRFSGGLIVDIGQPDYETRVAIMRRKVDEREAELADGVAEAMARFPFRNVRELQGALNRLLAVQDLEGRPVSAEDLARVLGRSDGPGPGGRRTASATAPAPASSTEAPWKGAFREVVTAVEAAGYSAHRLRRIVDAEDDGPEDWRGVLQAFRADVDRLREMRRELDALGNPWPEAAATLLRDPDRLEEAENLLSSARERARPFPEFPPGPLLGEVGPRFPPLATRAAERMIGAESPEYGTLYLHSPDSHRTRALLEVVGRSFRQARPGGRVGMISVSGFAEEFIGAISEGVAGAWRERWWSADLILLHQVEGLSFTERAQEEFFHLFEALKRRGGRMVLAADRPPRELEGVEDRLRSRFEGGLVIDLGVEDEFGADAGADAGAGGGSATSDEGRGRGADEEEGEDVLASLRAFAGVDTGPAGGVGTDPGEPNGPREDLIVRTIREREGTAPEGSEWYPIPERVVWHWPRMEERIVEYDR